MQIIDDSIDFEKYLNLPTVSEIRSPEYWRDSLHELFENEQVYGGDLLPWSKTYERVQLRSGEVSIWAGINGHGKSMLSGMVSAWLLQDTRVCIASMEMKPEQTLRRMVRQASGSNQPSRMFRDHFLAWTDGKLWIYDKLDQVPIESILGMVTYCAQELDIKHIFIDSLMKCGIDDDNYNGQKRFVDQLCQLAKQLDVHIHLVAHMRKGETENKVPSKFDVLGASALTNLVDNLFIVHRNKAKEEKIALGAEYDDNEPDCTLTVAKQRHGEWEGRILLWFHDASQQYTPTKANRVMPFELK